MSNPVLDPDYWAERLRTAREQHRAICECDLDKWRSYEAKHKEILKRLIKPTDSVLDIGCAWGRLLDLLPPHGKYCGVDLSPDFIKMAMHKFPGKRFILGDARNLYKFVDAEFDWSVLVSIVPMLRREVSDEVADQVVKEALRVSRRVLYLEYDLNSEGTVVEHEQSVGDS